MLFCRNKVASSIAIGFVSFALTTSAYAVVSVATPPSVGFKPIATKTVTASGGLGPSEVIALSGFGYTDSDGDALDITSTMATVQWYIMDGTTKTNLGNQGASSITIPADAGGKKLGLKYTIKTSTGHPDTAHEETDIILTVANGGGITGGGGGGEIGRGSAVDPTAVSVAFSSTPTDALNGTTANVPVVGTVLTANLTCVAGTSCEDADFTYQWKVADAATPNNLTDIASATGKTYTLEKTDQNKVFVVDVVAKVATP